MVVDEEREFRFRGDLYSQESTFPLVIDLNCVVQKTEGELFIGTQCIRYILSL